jgi:putative glutamine amidotransferase
MVKNIDCGGIIFTGGNTLSGYGGDAPERDETEKVLLDCAIKKGIPVYGLCRGMQFILDYFGYRLEPVEGHVAVRHKVGGALANREVNSYHNYGALISEMDSGSVLDVLAVSEDGVVESVKHKEYPILATMWHPERNNPFERDDIKMIKELFDR